MVNGTVSQNQLRNILVTLPHEASLCGLGMPRLASPRWHAGDELSFLWLLGLDLVLQSAAWHPRLQCGS